MAPVREVAAGATAVGIALVLGGAVPAAALEFESGYVIVAADGVLVEAVESADRMGTVSETMPELDMAAAGLTATEAAALDAVPGVEVYPDEPLSLLGEVVDPAWGLDRIDERGSVATGDDLYAFPSGLTGGDGFGVVAYVVDTGIRADHVVFGTRVSSGYSTVDAGDGRTDCNGHGTHVSGTIAGQTVGVAPGATLIPIRVFGCAGDTYTSDVLESIDWILTHHGSEPAVVNMSIGGAATPVLDAAIAVLAAEGIVPVVAAGKDAVDACASSPACAPDAIITGGCQMVCVSGVHLEGEHHGDHGYQSGARGAQASAEGAR